MKKINYYKYIRAFLSDETTLEKNKYQSLGNER
jgi:hypothetical protein